MLYLDILKYIRPIEEVDAQLEPHRDWLRRGFASGHFLMAGRREPRIGGVILIKADSLEEARALVEADPFITEGVAAYDLIAWDPTMVAPETPAHWGPAATMVA